MMIKERTWSSSSYRFGFNGMEKDDEVKGDGNSMDFGARIYDSRLGKWMSIDPLWKMFQSHSPFNFAINSPILFLDPDGRKIKPASDYSNEKVRTTLISVFKNEHIVYSIFNLNDNKDFKDYDGKVLRPNGNFGIIEIGNPDFDNLTSKAFKKQLKKLGKANGVKFKGKDVKLAFAWYKKVADNKTYEILVTKGDNIIQNTEYARSMGLDGETTLKAESEDLVKVLQDFSGIQKKNVLKDEYGEELKNDDGTPQYNSEAIKKGREDYLNTETGGTGVKVYNSGDILIDDSDGNSSDKLNTAVTK
jgi:RHS repeat-associated protein